MMRPNSEDGFFGRVRRLILYDGAYNVPILLTLLENVLCSYVRESRHQP